MAASAAAADTSTAADAWPFIFVISDCEPDDLLAIRALLLYYSCARLHILMTESPGPAGKLAGFEQIPEFNKDRATVYVGATSSKPHPLEDDPTASNTSALFFRMMNYGATAPLYVLAPPRDLLVAHKRKFYPKLLCEREMWIYGSFNTRTVAQDAAEGVTAMPVFFTGAEERAFYTRKAAQDVVDGGAVMDAFADLAEAAKDAFYFDTFNSMRGCATTINSADNADIWKLVGAFGCFVREWNWSIATRSRDELAKWFDIDVALFRRDDSNWLSAHVLVPNAVEECIVGNTWTNTSHGIDASTKYTIGASAPCAAPTTVVASWSTVTADDMTAIIAAAGYDEDAIEYIKRHFQKLGSMVTYGLAGQMVFADPAVVAASFITPRASLMQFATRKRMGHNARFDTVPQDITGTQKGVNFIAASGDDAVRLRALLLETLGALVPK